MSRKGRAKEEEREPRVSSKVIVVSLSLCVCVCVCCSTAQEREGFVAAQTHTKDIVHGRTGSIQRHGSKDCVIS